VKKELPAVEGSSGFIEKGEIGSVLERYELKYTIPYSMVDEISAFVEAYCFLDKYSEKSPDRFYKINSLYFDTPDFLFLRKRLAREHRRFNMRIRSYGDNPQLPYFLEVKQKRGDIIKKLRAKVFNADLDAMLNGPVEDSFLSGDKEAPSRAAFLRLRHIYNAQPQVIVQYRRKAYISHYEDYARVTFDKELCYMEQHDYSPVPVEGQMTSCDIENEYDPGCNLILELKCYTSYVPLWMVDCIRKFQLKRRGFSKFSTCLMPIFARRGWEGHDITQSAIMRYDDDD
jgi:hypothetical protein